MDQLQQKLNKAKAFDILMDYYKDNFSIEKNCAYNSYEMDVEVECEHDVAHITKEEFDILKEVGIVEVK